MTTQENQSKKTIHPWSSQALFGKALRYATEMQTLISNDWRNGLYSAFVLEFVARSALAFSSPALLADGKDWDNVYFALGHEPTKTKFIPKSIDISAVLKHLREINPTFTSELEGFAAQHINRRNEELHAGSLPFDGLKTNWLAPFYECCKVLLAIQSRSLASLFGAEKEQLAEQLIAAFRDESAKSVSKAIEAHKTVWAGKAKKEQEKLQQQATAWATRHNGHRAQCPACGSDALVVGDAVAAPIRTLDGDLIVEVQEHLPSKFECVACQLKISGLSQLTACDLGATYKSTCTYDAADYYASDDDYSQFEDDNNEY
jgi:hypothetical protein